MKSPVLLLSFIFSITLSDTAFSQYPPAQGPAAVTGPTGIREVPVRSFTVLLDKIFKDTVVPMINKSIDESNPPVAISVSHSLNHSKPFISQTKYESQPNQRIITIPYRVTYNLNINNFPDRVLYQNIEVNISCPDWYKTTGGIVYVTAVPEKPYLDGPSITEQVINAFVGNWLTPFIDNKIKSSLPEMVRRGSPLEALTPECNCLSVDSGTPPLYDNGAIQYQLKNTGRISVIETASTNVNTITVRIDSIRRLSAKNYETGEILYAPVENINLEVWVNQTLKTFEVSNINEGEARRLPDNTTTLSKPGRTGSLIIIANTIQQNFNTDTWFEVYTSRRNFGNGKRKITIKKSFYSKPRRLPGGGMSKPQKISVNAYEIMLSVDVYNPVVR